MSAHKHAESMRLYAEDACQTTEPWLRWEMTDCGSWWTQCDSNPNWLHGMQYRRKARTITIEGVTLPAPEIEAPTFRTKIYYMDPYRRTVIESEWFGDTTDRSEHIENGQIFLHRDHAQQWADFIVSTMTRGREKGDE